MRARCFLHCVTIGDYVSTNITHRMCIHIYLYKYKQQGTTRNKTRDVDKCKSSIKIMSAEMHIPLVVSIHDEASNHIASAMSLSYVFVRSQCAKITTISHGSVARILRTGVLIPFDANIFLRLPPTQHFVHDSTFFTNRRKKKRPPTILLCYITIVFH